MPTCKLAALLLFPTILSIQSVTRLSAQSSSTIKQQSLLHPAHAPLLLKKPVQDKNFYLLSQMERDPVIQKILASNTTLQGIAATQRSAVEKARTTCKAEAPCIADLTKWQDADVQGVAENLRNLYPSTAAMHQLVQNLRRCGCYQKYEAQSDERLLESAWRDAAAGINRIIATYAAGVPPRYPAIDSPAYQIKSTSYGHLVAIVLDVLQEEPAASQLFFQPSLHLALQLLEINRRDEAGRFEPLEKGENREAYRRIASIDWKRFPYSVIVIPGAGSEIPNVSLSPFGKLRLAIAVKRFRDGRAPFLMVSGGFVHPSQTPYNEAIEMKKSLVSDFGIPANSILVEPHARHTTTNLRNAVRLVYRYGIPFDKPALVTTDVFQSKYIENENFKQRCQTELGYQPVLLGRRVSQFDQEFTPQIASLYADSSDPLDP